MKEIFQKIFVILIVLLSISCVENKDEENLDKYLNIRKQALIFNRKDIGDTKEKIIENLKNTIKFDQLIKFVERETYKSNLKSRKIGSDLFEFKETIWNNSSDAKVKIQLRYLVNHDTIRFGLLKKLRINNQNISENFIYREDKRFITKFIDKHNDAFSSKKTRKDLINYLTKFEKVRIASGQGGAYYGKKETKMYCGLKKENFDFIDVLLNSINPEDQAIGVIGYNELTSLHLEKNKERDKWVAKILSVNPEINVQYGCTDKTLTIKKYLNLLNWDEIPNTGLNCTDEKKQDVDSI